MIKLNDHFILICPSDPYEDDKTYENYYIRHIGCIAYSIDIEAITPVDAVLTYRNGCWNCKVPFTEVVVNKAKFIAGNDNDVTR